MNIPLRSPRNRTIFRIFEVDLERFVRRMRKAGEAFTLTALARRWIRGRLRYGQESGHLIPIPDEGVVRFWDPLKAWHPGDWAVFPVTYTRHGVLRQEPRAGQVARVMDTALIAQIDGEEMPRMWGMPARYDNAEITRWRASLDRYIARLGQSRSERARIDHMLFQHGPHIIGGLLAALRSDGRFVEWEGRWFLRSLVKYPNEAQLVTLARTLLIESSDGVRLSELLSLMPLTEADDPPTSFGFGLAMSERPGLFSRVEAGRYTRWVLVSPPPGNYEAKFAVYDPRTYEVICENGDHLNSNQVELLWQLGLLATAVYGSP